MNAVLERNFYDLESVVRQSEPTRREALAKLSETLRSAAEELIDDDKFCSFFKQAQALLEMDDEELRVQLKVSRPTVNRWARGVTAPHAIVQESVFKTMARLADTKLKRKA